MYLRTFACSTALAALAAIGLSLVAVACGFGDNDPDLFATCGDGFVDPGEDCDDGNAASGDGCSSACDREAAARCSLMPQSGCPGGFACDLSPSDNTTPMCRAITGIGDADDTCTNDTMCGPGFTCAVSPGETIASCRQFCTNDNDCDTGAACGFALTNTNGHPTARVCSNLCDLGTQVGCPSGLACAATHVEGPPRDVTDCMEYGGATQIGNICSSTDQCRAGSRCVLYSGGSSYCRPYCAVGLQTCGSGYACTAFSPPTMINGINHGFCP